MLRRSNSDTRGFVLAWTAVLLTLFLLMAALAVDLGFWYLRKNNLQRAADAAASAAVVVRTSDRGTAIADATAVALDIAAKNGYTVGPTVTVTATTLDAAGNPLPRNQFRVVIRKQSDNFFLKIIGMNTSSIVAESTAQYTEPVQLGSPSNIYGREPVIPGEPSWNTGTLPPPQMWASIAAPNTKVTLGDAFSAKNCQYSTTFPDAEAAPDVCDASDNPLFSVGGGADGYNIIVDTRGTMPGETVEIQLYDPTFTEQGMGCLWGPAYALGRFRATDAYYATPPGPITAATAVPSNCAGDTSVNSCFGGVEDCGGGGTGGGGGFSTLRDPSNSDKLERTDAGCFLIYPCNDVTRMTTTFRLFAPTSNASVVDPSAPTIVDRQFGYYWATYSADQHDAAGHRTNCVGGLFNSQPGPCFGAPTNAAGNSNDGLIAHWTYNTLDIVGNFGIQCAGNKYLGGACGGSAFGLYDRKVSENRSDIIDLPTNPTDTVANWAERTPGDQLPREGGDIVGRLGQNRFRDTYHKWVPFASIPSVEQGLYVLNVSTRDALPGQTSRGINNFSVRARVTGGSSSTVKVFPYERMAVQANTAGISDQYIAKAPTGASTGKFMSISAFDLADIAQCGSVLGLQYPNPQSCERAPSGVSGNLSFGRYVGGTYTPLSSCGIAIGAATSSFSPTPDCTIPLNSSTLGSKTLKVRVDLGSFTCTTDDCWIVARTDLPTANGPYPILPSDTMTWTAKVEGDPVSITR